MTVICDFCSSTAVCWSYPAKDFVAIEGVAGSEGGWAACQQCHDLIEADNRIGLTARSAHFFAQKNHIPARLVRAQLTKLHKQFFAHRTGPAVPYPKEEA